MPLPNDLIAQIQGHEPERRVRLEPDKKITSIRKSTQHHHRDRLHYSLKLDYCTPSSNFLEGRKAGRGRRGWRGRRGCRDANLHNSPIIVQNPITPTAVRTALIVARGTQNAAAFEMIPSRARFFFTEPFIWTGRQCVALCRYAHCCTVDRRYEKDLISNLLGPSCELGFL